MKCQEDELGGHPALQGEDPGFTINSAYFLLSWHFIIQPATKFFEVDSGEEKCFLTIYLDVSWVNNSLIFRVYKNAERVGWLFLWHKFRKGHTTSNRTDELFNKTEANYVCWG